MTFDTFKENIAKKAHDMREVPLEYLNDEGKKARRLYADVDFVLSFCDSFCELDDSLSDSPIDGLDGKRLQIIHQWAEEERRLNRVKPVE